MNNTRTTNCSQKIVRTLSRMDKPCCVVMLLNYLVSFPLIAQSISGSQLDPDAFYTVPPLWHEYTLEMTPELQDSWIDETEDYFSAAVHDFSTFIDHGLAKSEEEQQLENRSYLRFRTNLDYTHRGYFESKGRISIRVDLPHVEKDWNLIFDTDPDDYDSLENKQRDLGTRNSDNPVDGAIGGVRLEGDRLKHWRTKFDVGIKIRFPLDPFVRTEFRRVENVSENWVTQFTQEFFYYDSIGPGSLSELNFYHALKADESRFLKISSSAQYLHDDVGWELLQQFTIADRLDLRNLMEYSTGIDVEPEDPDEISNYWLSATWRHRLYNDWLFMAVTTQIDAPREFDHKANPGVLFELEAFFSKNRRIDRLRRKFPESTRRAD